jgi:hypothetical protein
MQRVDIKHTFMVRWQQQQINPPIALIYLTLSHLEEVLYLSSVYT